VLGNIAAISADRSSAFSVESVVGQTNSRSGDSYGRVHVCFPAGVPVPTYSVYPF